jgi:hypothetical protein
VADGDGTSPPATEPPKGEPLAERVGAIEAEQQRQGGILERIEQALAGSPKASGTPSTGPTPDGGTTGGLSVAEQVRQGVEEIEARKAKEAADAAAADADKAWRASVDERLPERKPSEPATGRKVRLQERLFGRADAR